MHWYNRFAAAKYASTWALYRNPLWTDDSTISGGGGDCTNFVSQALHAGGWTMVTGSYKNIFPWYSDYMTRRGRTPSWASANHFGLFLKHSGRARPCLVPELTFGDVVQMGFQGNDYPSHTMIVSNVAHGIVYLSYHSTDHLNTSMQDVLSRANSGSWFTNWKIYDLFE